MSVQRSAYLRMVILCLAVVASVAACKSQKKGNSAAPDPQAANRASCTANFGTWENNYCRCNVGYRAETNNPNRCVRDQRRPEDCTGNTVWDNTRSDCVDRSQVSPAGTTTARQCFDRGGWWNGTACSTNLPANQSDCLRYGDQWQNNSCTRIDPYNKENVCRGGGGNWSDTGCGCQSGTFDWSYYRRCVDQSNGNGGPGQYPPEQQCSYGNGQWNGSSCMCPGGLSFDQNQGRCMSSNGYNPYCPGQFDARGMCVSMSGEQMLYNVLYGWILQSLYLDNPDRPAEKAPEGKGDGH